MRDGLPSGTSLLVSFARGLGVDDLDQAQDAAVVAQNRVRVARVAVQSGHHVAVSSEHAVAMHQHVQLYFDGATAERVGKLLTTVGEQPDASCQKQVASE